MVRLGSFFGLLAVTLIFGCSAVSSVGPVGERPKELTPDEWDGTWILKNQSITVKVLEPQRGTLQVAWVEEKEGRLELESFQVEIKESDDWMLGNVREEEGSSRYYWALMRKDGGQIIVWYPDPSQFAKLVEAGTLRGKVEKGGSVIIEKLAREDLKLVLSGDKGVCFDWKRPMVLFRVGK